MVKMLKEMEHSDEIVTSDANFRLPVTSEIWKIVMAAML
jgi:L-fucose mutarotase/ribose pyranase (RbsD/FucU family)